MAMTAVYTGTEEAFIGSEITGQVTASGGVAPYSYAVTAGALPDGVSLDPATGAISGIATAAGNFDATVTATDSTLPVAQTADADVPIFIEAALVAPAIPTPYRNGVNWRDDDCLTAQVGGRQMVRLFFDAMQSPQYITNLRGNLQSPVGLFKSLMFNILWSQIRVSSGDLQGAAILIEASQSLQRIALAPPVETGSLTNGNALADIWLNGCVPFYIADDTNISVTYGGGASPIAVPVRLYFCNWEIPPFILNGTDNWSD